MRKKYGLLALALALLALTGCTQEVAVIPELIEPVGVESDSAAAYIGEIYEIEHCDAAVVPYVEELFFEVPGSVAVVHAYPGMLVEEGDILVELDQTSLEERAEQLRRELEYAEKDNAFADAMAELDIQILETELRMMREKRADEVQIALKENEIAQKRASLRQTQKLRQPELEDKRRELEDISISLERNVLRAPFSGRIIYGKQLTQGTKVTAYDPIAFISDDSRLTVRGEYISDSILLGADRLFARIGAHEYELERIPVDQKEFVALALSGATITSEYEIVGPEEYMDLLEPGQYAGVCIVSDYQADALLVPSGAVLKEAAGRYVYVNEGGGRVRRSVKIGKVTDGLTQITEGLEEGEVVYVKD